MLVNNLIHIHFFFFFSSYNNNLHTQIKCVYSIWIALLKGEFFGFSRILKRIFQNKKKLKVCFGAFWGGVAFFIILIVGNYVVFIVS